MIVHTVTTSCGFPGLSICPGSLALKTRCFSYFLAEYLTTSLDELMFFFLFQLFLLPLLFIEKELLSTTSGIASTNYLRGLPVSTWDCLIGRFARAFWNSWLGGLVDCVLDYEPEVCVFATRPWRRAWTDACGYMSNHERHWLPRRRQDVMSTADEPLKDL